VAAVSVAWESDQQERLLWAGRACFHLKPIAEHMGQHLAHADRLFMDETTAPGLE
jgi:hypothetical protein